VALSLVAPASLDDSELVAACVRGDVTAQRTLFRREYPRMFRTVSRILGGGREVDDLVQEAFVHVFRALASYRGEAKLSRWIDRITIRVVFHHLRGRKCTVSLDAIGDVDNAERVDERAHAREGLRRLYDVLSELTPVSRTAYALFAIDGRSIAEVATLTNTTVVAAKLRIWRARREVHRRAASDPVLAELVLRKGAS